MHIAIFEVDSLKICGTGDRALRRRNPEPAGCLLLDYLNFFLDIVFQSTYITNKLQHSIVAILDEKSKGRIDTMATKKAAKKPAKKAAAKKKK